MTIDQKKILKQRARAERAEVDEATLPPWITGQPPQDLSRVLWRALDPERADRLAAVSPDEAERVRRVDILCSIDATLNVEDMLQVPLADLRALDDSHIVMRVKRKRKAIKLREKARKGRQSWRLPSDGVTLADDWRIVEGQLERRERWMSWVGDDQVESVVWAPKKAAWTEWRGKSIRTDTIVYALTHPEMQLPGGLARRGRRSLPKA
jgi:hypothetical protein